MFRPSLCIRKKQERAHIQRFFPPTNASEQLRSLLCFIPSENHKTITIPSHSQYRQAPACDSSDLSEKLPFYPVVRAFICRKASVNPGFIKGKRCPERGLNCFSFSLVGEKMHRNECDVLTSSPRARCPGR